MVFLTYPLCFVMNSYTLRGFQVTLTTYFMRLKQGKLLRVIRKLVRPIKPLVFKIDKYTGKKLSGRLGILSAEEKRVEYTPEERREKIDEVIRQVRLPIPNEQELKRVEIVVLKYKDPEVETKCAQLLIENTEWPYKLNFYDNRPGTKNMSKIWNKLIRESTCDYLVIMDSDIFVPKMGPCWLTRLMDTFEKKSDCLVVSPRITKTSCVQQKGSVAEDKEPEKFHEAFAGMCTLYKKEVFEKVGYFDEDFLLYGSDSEWAFRCLKSGAGAYLRPDVVVDHISHYSTGKEARAAKLAVVKTLYDASIEREYAGELYNEKTK